MWWNGTAGGGAHTFLGKKKPRNTACCPDPWKGGWSEDERFMVKVNQSKKKDAALKGRIFVLKP